MNVCVGLGEGPCIVVVCWGAGWVQAGALNEATFPAIHFQNPSRCILPFSCCHPPPMPPPPSLSILSGQHAHLSLLAPQSLTPPTLETKKSLLIVTFQRGQLSPYWLRRHRRSEPTFALMVILASQLAWKLPRMEVTSGQNTDISS